MFISFEGLDCCGKTTIAKKVVEYLNANDAECIYTREPGGTIIGEKLRALLVNDNNDICPSTELMLFMASRNEHIEKVIKPSLSKRIYVVCDRFVDSTIAYQSGINMSIYDVMVKHQNTFDNLLPDITFFINVDIDVCINRINDSRRSDSNQLDFKNMDRYKKIYNNYIELLRLYPSRIVNVDGNRSIDEIFKDVMTIINTRSCEKYALNCRKRKK